MTIAHQARRARPGRALLAAATLLASMATMACPAHAGASPSAGAPASPSSSAKETTMTASAGGPPTRSSSRIRAPEVAPVVHQGVRYEPLKAASSEGLAPGIYVTATDVASGKRLWTARLWETTYDGRKELDVQNVFLRSLTLDEAAKVLKAEDERGRKAAVSVKDGAVQVLP